MSDKELYQQKLQAQLDEWKAEIAKLKAKAARARAETRIEMNQRIEGLEKEIEKGETKLSALADAGDDTWESIQEGVESTWRSLKSGFDDTVSRFKE